MRNNTEKNSTTKRSSYRQLEEVVGCKWSISVLQAIADGVSRPGALERHIAGISTKVLGERLHKLTAYGLLSRQVFPEVPPRTEYTLTENGIKLAAIIAQLQRLDNDIRSATSDHLM